MANNTLEIQIKAQDYATKELKKVEKQVKGMKGVFKNAGNSIKDFGKRNAETFKKIGIGAAAAGAAIGVMGKKFLDLGTEIEQVDKKSATVFGNYIDGVREVAKETAKSMGLSQNEYMKAASGLQDLLIPMGFTREAATKMTTDTIALSGALAEWSNGQYDAAQASEILAKAFLGETEQLKSMGISISTGSDEFKALRNEIMETTGVTGEQAQALAIQKLILEKSTDAQNAFKEGSGSLARQQAELSATIKDARDSVAKALIPAFNELLKVIAPVIEQVATSIQKWAENKENIEQLKATLMGFIEVMKFIGQVIGTIIGILYKMGEGLGLLTANIVIFTSKGIDKFTEFADGVGAIFSAVKEKIVGIFNSIKETVIGIIQSMLDFAFAAVDKIKGAFDKAVAIKDKISKTIGGAASAVSGAVTSVVSGARATGGPVTGGKTYLVGERGPELFTAPTSGKIIPNNQLGGGMNININMGGVSISKEADENRLVNKIKQELTRTIQLSRLGIS